MLNETFTTKEAHRSFDLKMKMDRDWSTSKRRVLVIIQTVDGSDLHAEEMASTPAIPNAIKYARQIARKYNPDLPNFAFAVTNFNSRHHLHMRGSSKAEAESEFKARQLRLIKKLNPTHILFSGDLNVLYPMDHAQFKNGWVHNIDGRKVVSTLDFGRLMEKQGTHANLLGFWCRHLANLLLGKHPHNLSHVTAKPVVIDSLVKFKKLLALWDEAKVAAVDTETKNLSVTANAIYTIQFAFNQKPETGYVLPIDHPHEDNPFSKEDRKVIKRELKKRFGAYKGPELVTFNGVFDLRIIRQALKLDIIFLPVWEIMAGEHLLDENISSLASIGIKSGGLAAIYCAYGNDFYLNKDTKFSKEERSTVGSVSPLDKDFLAYCFPPSALVGTDKGDVEISKLKPGDLVWSLNHATDQAELKPVLNVMKTPARKRMVRLIIEGACYTMTEDHPVWSDDRKDYVPASSIVPGERLRMLNQPPNLCSS